MQEPLFTPTLTRKLYNERSVLLGTFLGGPLVGGYLIAQNFKALDEPANAGKTWIITILTFVLCVATVFVPVLDQLPGLVYSAVFCIAAHRLTRKFQGSRIVLHQENGGQLYSTGRAVLIGVVCFLFMLGLFLGAFYLADQAV